MSRRRSQEGQSLVEGALVITALVFTITAILDLGQIFMFLQFFNERVRAGARYSAVHTYDPTALKNFIVHNTPNPARPGAPGLMGLTANHVSIQRLDAGTERDRIVVTISNFPMRFYCPLLAGSYTHRAFRAFAIVESLGATN